MREDFTVQLRDWDGEISHQPTLKAALAYAARHPAVYKISFDLPTGERARLVRHRIDGKLTPFFLEQMDDHIDEVLHRLGRGNTGKVGP